MKTISKAMIGTVAAGAMALASATPAMAQDRYRDHDRGGISVGEIIAGALVIGGIAAVAGSIGKDRYRGGTYGEPYYSGGYQDRYNDRYYRNAGSPRQAVEQCVRAAERSSYRARVTDIRDVDQNRYGYRVKGTVVVNERGSGWGRDYDYRYSGRNYDQGRFTCDVQNGRVVGLDYNGLRNNNRYGYGYGY